MVYLSFSRILALFTIALLLVAFGTAGTANVLAAAERAVVISGERKFNSRDFERPFAAVAAGSYHTAALREDGSVVAWGNNQTGQCDVPAGLTGVKAIAAGGQLTLALRKDGTVVSWGWFGQPVPAGLGGVTAIAAGGNFGLALKNDGTLVTWGANSNAGLPVPAGLNNVIAIAAGSYHALALKSDGTVVAWGQNDNRPAVVPAGLNGVTAIATGERQSVALKSDGTVVTWDQFSNDPQTVSAGLEGVIAIAAGDSHAAALKNDGTVVAWGDNNNGQSAVPLELAGVKAIGAGGAHSVALKNDGTLVAWGSALYGQAMVWDPRFGAKAIAADYDRVLALRDDGAVIAWGGLSGPGTPGEIPELRGATSISTGPHLALGVKPDGTLVGTHSPPSISNVKAVSVRGNLSLILKNDGTVVPWGFGENSFGEWNVPAGLDQVTAVAAGAFHGLALQEGGTVVAWGSNEDGQATVPPGLDGVTAIAAGYFHSVALKNDGTVVAWGANNDGQCNVPAGLTGVTAIAAGFLHTIALKADGSIVTWGYGQSGQNHPHPALPKAIAVAGGYAHTVALLDRPAPTIAPPVAGFASVVAVEGSPLPDFSAQVVATDYSGSAVTLITQDPPPGTVLPPGRHQVVLTATDDAGYTASIALRFRVAPVDPLLDLDFSTGHPVPGAGVAESGIPADAVWDSFGNPAINAAGDLALLATYRAGRTKTKAIVLKRPSDGEPRILARVGGPIPNYEWYLSLNTTFTSLGDPLLAADGNVLFLATVKGLFVNAASNKVLIVYPGPSSTGSDSLGRVAARTGSVMTQADGAILKSIDAIALESGDAAVLRGSLAVGSGNPAVRPADDRVVFRVNLTMTDDLPAGFKMAVLAREGRPLVGSSEVVQSFYSLVSGEGTAGQGRGWLARQTEDALEVPVFTSVVTFPNRTRAIVERVLGSDAYPTATQLTGPGGMLVDGAPNSFFLSAGIPVRWSAPAAFAFYGVPNTAPAGIFTGTTATSSATRFAGVGVNTTIPGSDLRYKTLNDPVVSIDGSIIAFAGTVAGTGVTGANNEALFWGTLDEPAAVEVLAREGNPAAEADGARWKSFNSLAVPGGGNGPIFTAKLAHGRPTPTVPGTPPLPATNAGNDDGLWVLATTGDLRLLLREGDVVNGKKVKFFEVLRAVSAAPGSTRNFNANGEIVARVIATDNTTHILRILVP